MIDQSSHSERGQAIVYLVIGIVVFLGFVALAIDGGMVLADRRNAQNASDAASLAGGAAAASHLNLNRSNVCKKQWSCQGGTITGDSIPKANTAANQRAADNNFTNSNKLTDVNVSVGCRGSEWNYAGITVTVDISATTPSNFLQVISPGALHNKVDAVTTVDPGGPLQYGNAIVALNPASCTGQIGVSFHGTADINIQGGGVFSNGCVRSDGSSKVYDVPDPLDDSTIPNIKIRGNDLKYDPTKDIIDPPPTTTTEQIPKYTYDIDPPDCSKGKGWFTDSTLPTSLNGLYCVTGDLTFKKGPYNGTDVTIFVQDGKLTINGNEDVTLDAPPSDFTGAALPGILFYLPQTNHNEVKLNGTSKVTISGVVFAPGSNIVLTGTDDVISFMSTQFIGWDVNVGGTQQTNIVYNACDGYISPPSLQLYK